MADSAVRRAALYVEAEGNLSAPENLKQEGVCIDRVPYMAVDLSHGPGAGDEVAAGQ